MISVLLHASTIVIIIIIRIIVNRERINKHKIGETSAAQLWMTENCQPNGVGTDFEFQHH